MTTVLDEIAEVILNKESRVLFTDRRKKKNNNKGRGRTTDINPNKKIDIAAIAWSFVFEKDGTISATIHKQVQVDGKNVLIFDRCPNSHNILAPKNVLPKEGEKEYIETRLKSHLNGLSFHNKVVIAEKIFKLIISARDYLRSEGKDGKLMILVEKNGSIVSKLVLKSAQKDKVIFQISK